MRRASVTRGEHLAVNVRPVGGVEHDRLRPHERRRRKRGRHRPRQKRTRRAAVRERHDAGRRGARVHVRELPARELDGRPLIGLGPGEPAARAAADCDAPDVARIGIALVRRVDQIVAARPERDLLDIEIARRQQLRRPAGRRHRIEMRTAVALPFEREPPVARPPERPHAVRREEFAAPSAISGPDDAARSGRGIGDRDRPRRPRTRRVVERERLRVPRQAHEGDLRSVGRPDGGTVARKRRRRVHDPRRAERVDRDVRVIAAVVRDGDARAVGRPKRIARRPADGEQRGGFLRGPRAAAVARRDRGAHHLARTRAVASDPRDAIALRGDDGLLADPEFDRRFARKRRQQNLPRLAFRRIERIRIYAAAVLAEASALVDDRARVRHERDAAEFSAVVGRLVRDLANATGLPHGDIPRTAFVDGPPECVALRRRGEIVDERCREHRVEREGRRLGVCRRHAKRGRRHERRTRNDNGSKKRHADLETKSDFAFGFVFTTRRSCVARTPNAACGSASP